MITTWFIIMVWLGDGGSAVPKVMLQPFPSRAECEKSADFAMKAADGIAGGQLITAYCIPRAAK